MHVYRIKESVSLSLSSDYVTAGRFFPRAYIYVRGEEAERKEGDARLFDPVFDTRVKRVALDPLLYTWLRCRRERKRDG